jgi:hypothetical protein
MKRVNAVFIKKAEVFCPRSLASELAGYSGGFNTYSKDQQLVGLSLPQWFFVDVLSWAYIQCYQLKLQQMLCYSFCRL